MNSGVKLPIPTSTHNEGAAKRLNQDGPMIAVAVTADIKTLVPDSGREVVTW